MLKVLLMSFVFFPNIFPGAAREWVPLCEKYQRSDLVFEMEFEVVEEYSPTHRERQWPPPAEDLKKIAATGKIVQVFKGEGLKPEMTWEAGFGYPFYHHASVAYWDAFFGRSRFRMVYFLKREGAGYRGTGGGEGTLGCRVSSHFSWCISYRDYLGQLTDCNRCTTSQGAYPRCY